MGCQGYTAVSSRGYTLPCNCMLRRARTNLMTSSPPNIGHVQVVEMLLENIEVDVNLGSSCNNAKSANAFDSSGGYSIPSPLGIACEHGHVQIVELLLANAKVDVNKGPSPLAIACSNCHLHIVKLLIANPEMDVNKCSADSKGLFWSGGSRRTPRMLLSPLCYACLHKDTAMLNILLEHEHIDVNAGGASFGKQALRGEHCSNTTPLVLAIANSDTNAIDRLLAHDAIDVFKQGKVGWDGTGSWSYCYGSSVTPLFLACVKGNAKAVKHLLNNDDDIASSLQVSDNEPCYEEFNFEDEFGGSDRMKYTAAYAACCNGHLAVLTLILNHIKGRYSRHEIRSHDDLGMLPHETLVVACHRNDTDMIQALLAAGVNPDGCVEGENSEALRDEVRESGLGPEHEFSGDDDDIIFQNTHDFDWGAQYVRMR